MIRCPELLVFAVIDIVELTVPDESNAGEAGVTTDGSKVTWRSYANTPWPVRLPVVIGTTITPPGVGETLGSVTTMPASEGENSDVKTSASDVLTGEFTKIRLTSLDIPKFSKAEAINPKREPPAANSVTLNRKASAITAIVMPLALPTKKDLLSTDIKLRCLRFSP